MQDQTNYSIRKTEMHQPAKSFEDLVVWQKAHEFVLMIYRITKDMPKEEQYGLTSQVRRAAVSIAANITEGFKKRGQADKARYLNIAQGSLDEVCYYLILIKDLGYVDTHAAQQLSGDVRRLLDAFYHSVAKAGT